MSINKYFAVGNLTRDVETKSFASGGKVAKFGLAVNNRKKNSATGQWEDDPMYIDVEVYNRGEFGKLADLCEERLKKGSRVTVEARLELDQWDDKSTGQKRTKHKLVVEDIQIHEKAPAKADGGKTTAPKKQAQPAGDAGDDDNIPF